LKIQGVTEYLVLSGVILIMALVIIALLGLFPGLTTEREAESRAYWLAATPVQILDYSYSDTSLKLTFQNTEEPVMVDKIILISAETPVEFIPPQKNVDTKMILTINDMPQCNNNFDVQVEIYYDGNVFKGDKSLVGKCT
jgi:hypothetical protein